MNQVSEHYEHNVGGYVSDFPNTSGLTPLGHSVLIEPYEAQRTQTDSGIVLPKLATDNRNVVEQRAVVVAIGDCAWNDEPRKRALPGDHVLVVRYEGFMAGSDITADGKNYRLVSDKTIFCKIQPKE